LGAGGLTGPNVTRRIPPAIAMIGRLMTKIHRQETTSEKKPPTNGPEAMKQPATVVCSPKARPRRSGGKAWVTTAIEAGNVTAAPRPCRARAAISQPPVGARAASSEPAMKTAAPPGSAVRQPSMSPSLPPSARKQVKVRR